MLRPNLSGLLEFLLVPTGARQVGLDPAQTEAKRMAKIPPEEINAHDKRKAAIHEAGHVTVAMAIGKRCWAELHTTGTANPDQESCWTGRSGGYGIRFAPVIAVAGIVAECMDETDDPRDIDEWIEYGVVLPSETDMKFFTPEKQRLAIFTQAIDLLKRQSRFSIGPSPS